MRRRWIFTLLILLPACALPRAAGVETTRAVQVSLASQVAAVSARQEPPPCPITVAEPFVPPRPWPSSAPFAGGFWYGTPELWTMVPSDGTWRGLPLNPDGYTQKIFWWRDGYAWTDEPQPALEVSGRRLDGPAPALAASRATNAFAEDIRSAMLVGVGLPTLGCWEITGRYRDAELSFVVWVAD